MRNTFVLAGLAVGILAGGRAARSDAAATVRTPAEQPSPRQLAPQRIACEFEPNRGQTAPDVDYLAHCAGYVAFVTRGDAVIRASRDAFRIHFAGNRAATPHESLPLPGRSNYFVGNDSARWVTDVPHVGRVAYGGVLPGIDVNYHGDGGGLEFDVAIAAAAEAADVRFEVEGATSLGLDKDGGLRVVAGGAQFVLSAPRAHEEGPGAPTPIRAGYRLCGDGLVAFDVGRRTPGRALVIDPTVTLSASTYLGGSASEVAQSVTADSTGIYVSGIAYSTDFPTTAGAARTSKGDTTTSQGDAFVAKFNPAGTSLLWATYLGGSGYDAGAGLAVDGSGNVYVGGSTSSTDFPLHAPWRSTATGSTGFLAEISSTGSALTTSTYLPVRPKELGLDSSGNVYVFAGAGAQGGGSVSSFDAAVTQQRYSTSFTQTGWILQGMAVDPTGTVWVVGSSDNSSNSLTSSGAYQSYLSGNNTNGWIFKLDTSGNRGYTTYYGSGDICGLYDVALDPSGNLVLAGYAAGSFTTHNAYQSVYAGGGFDVFVAEFDPTCKTLQWSTYLGGSDIEYPASVAANANGDVYVTGYTDSANFPVLNASQTTKGSSGSRADAFVAKFASDGTLKYSTYLGGTGTSVDTNGYCVAPTWGGRDVVVGSTSSSAFPTHNAYQSALNGSADAFVSVIEESSNPFADMTVAALPQGTDGQSYSQTLPVTGGTAPLDFAVVRSTLPAGMTLSSAGVLSGTTTPAGTFGVLARIRDADGAVALRQYTLVVNPAPAVTTAALPAWTATHVFSQQLTYGGGTTPVSWSVGTVSDLPPGLAITTGGLLYGTPTTAGTYDFVCQLVDANGAVAGRAYHVVISEVPQITTTTLDPWTEFTSYSKSLATSGGTKPFTWTTESGVFPYSVPIDANGKLSGSTLGHGSYTFTARLTDAVGVFADRELSITLNPLPKITTARLPIAAAGRPYAVPVAATGGTLPYAFFLAAGSWPQGITLTSAGTLAGTPQQAGHFDVTVSCADAATAIASNGYGLDVAGLVDLTKGKSSETIAFTTPPSHDVVRFAEFVAGTTIDIALTINSKTSEPVELQLFDAAQTPLSLTDYEKVKKTSITVRRYPIVATGRYFIVLHPTPAFQGGMKLHVDATATKAWKATAPLDPAGAPIGVDFSALPGSKLVVSVAAAKKGAALPTIASVTDSAGVELLVPAELKLTKTGAKLTVKTPLAGGDYHVVFSGTGAAPGDVAWTITVKAPKGYPFALPDVVATGN